MKRWAILVAALYVLILAVLTVPFGLAAFAGEKNSVGLKDAAGVYTTWPYWAWLAVMGLAQVALLAVPVRFASRRPLSRGSLVPTVLASGLMMGGMVAGAVCAIYEVASHGIDMPDWARWSMPGVVGLSWCVWSLIFFLQGREEKTEDFISRQSRTLLTGSILELLVAVPTHIVARQRDYCCAGLMTFIGLTMGFSVMLFSFGPAVFFLFLARWKKLHPSESTS